MAVKEAFLHYVWRLKKFNAHDLKTNQGEAISLLETGRLNADAGPDFLNARLRIGDTLWAGNIEIHVKSSDWIKHGHGQDPAYDSVILHVVHEEDVPIFRKDGGRIPCLELKPRIPSSLVANYARLKTKDHWVPCASFLPAVSDMRKLNCLERVLVERLEKRVQSISVLHEACSNNLEHTFYQVLAKSFGQPVNATAFEQLALSLDLGIILKHRNNLLQTEALLFGQAGLLNIDFQDDWPKQLKREYQFLKHKHGLSPISPQHWKFLRMRPSNFPTIRISQFARLISNRHPLLTVFLDAQNLEALEGLLSLETSLYWHSHYVFDKASKLQSKCLGKMMARRILVNGILPFFFFYGRISGRESYQQKALNYLELLPPENNKIIKEWNTLGMPAQSAANTQALLQLKKEYCSSFKCLQCSIGDFILRGDSR